MESDHESPTETEVRYFVLGGRTNPYLLARIHWPDVAQAITAGCRDWQDDPGLFDLPYDSGSAAVSLNEALEIMAGWGSSLPTEGVLPREFIRRMPANWSNLSPAELRSWSLELVMRTRRAEVSETAPSSAPGRLERWRSRRSRRQVETVKIASPASGPDRRRHARVPIGGSAEIRYGSDRVLADIVDFSEGGVHWVVRDTKGDFAVGAKLDAPFVLPGNGSKSQVQLDFGGTVVWNDDTMGGRHFGVAFEALADEQLERIQHLLVASGVSDD